MTKAATPAEAPSRSPRRMWCGGWPSPSRCICSPGASRGYSHPPHWNAGGRHIIERPVATSRATRNQSSSEPACHSMEKGNRGILPDFQPQALLVVLRGPAVVPGSVRGGVRSGVDRRVSLSGYGGTVYFIWTPFGMILFTRKENGSRKANAWSSETLSGIVIERERIMKSFRN